MAPLKFTKTKEKHGISLVVGNLRRARSHHFKCCVKLS